MQIEIKTPFKGVRRCVLALAAASACAYAQTPATSAEGAEPEAELPPVTVSAHDGLAVPYDQTGVSVTILDVEQLKKQGITAMPEALSTVPGVFVLPGGDYQRGNTSTPTVRGLSKGAYTLPIIDGMRIHTAGNGNPGSNILARTNLFGLGDAEVLRGAEGATYGNGCMGAVVFMETPKGKGKPGGSTFQEAGSHDSYTGNITAQGESGPLSYFLSATYEHTNNDLRYAGGTKPSAPHAGQYRNWSEALRVDGCINERNSVTFTYRREDSSYTNADSPTAATRYRFRSNLVTAAWNSQFTDQWTSKLMAGFYGYDSDLGYGYTGSLRNVQTEWRNAYRWSRMNTTTFGLCWIHSDYSSSDLYSKDSGIQNTVSAFAEHTYRPTESWETSLAARMDFDNVVDERLTARAASSYRFQTTGTRIFGSVGTGYNAPSRFQCSRTTYHSPFGGDWVGNPGLRCETSVSADFGVEQQIKEKHYVSATCFWTQTRHAISPDYTSAPFSYRNETGHQTSQGVELSLRGTWEERWNTGYSAAYTLTRPMSDGRQICNSARQVWSADIHTSPLPKLTAGLGLSAASQRTAYDGRKLDNYYTLRLYARYDVTEDISLHLRVENLTNRKFVIQPGYDNPYYGYPDLLGAGVSVFGGVNLRF